MELNRWKFHKGGGFDMTILHILNFAIPIVCIAGAGFLMDHLCKPATDPSEISSEESTS